MRSMGSGLQGLEDHCFGVELIYDFEELRELLGVAREHEQLLDDILPLPVAEHGQSVYVLAEPQLRQFLSALKHGLLR